MRNNWRDPTIGRILNEVAKEFHVEPSVVRELYEQYFAYAAEVIKTGQMADISIFGLGRFVPNTRELISISKKCDIGFQQDCEYCHRMIEALKRVREEKIKRKRNKDNLL